MIRHQLHDYQHYGAKFIVDAPLSALLLQCGLGKTIITLTAINDLMFDSFQINKVLVVCPLRVGLNVWKQECENWEHLQNLRCAIAIGTEAERLSALRSPADIYILNRENVEWFVEKSGLFLKLKYDMLIVDESSSFKNHQTKRFKALMKLRPQVKRVVLLSATPAANNLMDLWSQFRLLDLGQRLGRFIGKYRDTYFVPDKRNQQMVFSYKPKPGAEEAIYKKISDITISMKNTDYLKLPELVMNEIFVQLSEAEKRHYQTMKDEMVLSLDGKDIDAANAAALSGKLLQLASGAVYDEHGGVVPIHDRKLDALEDIIEATNGKPVLIAYWFKHDLKRILERFPGEQLDSEQSICRWNAGEIPIALIHPASAGHGLNLQAGGCALVWFSLMWSLELYQQTNARLWRQGQKETVVIHHLVAKDTIDENVMVALAKKDAGQAALLEAVKARMGEGRK